MGQPGSSQNSVPEASASLPSATKCPTVRHHYDEQVYSGEAGKKEVEWFTCGKRHSEEAKAVRNRLMLEACLPPRTRVTSGSELLPMAMSESMTARVCVDTHSPCYHQGLQDAEGLGY